MSVQIQTLRGRNQSGSEDLDLLFNNKDGILIDDTDTLISFNNTDDALMFDKEMNSADDLFSNLLNVDFDLTAISQTSYDTAVASPGNSDSGISDGVNSPQCQSDSQSGGSPQRIDELEEVIMESADMSSYLIGSDMMLMEETNFANSDLETVGFEWDLKLSPNESKKSALPLTVQDVKIISATMSTRTISTSDSSYPKLRLTDEEKRLLAEMNVDLPTDMPLTKEEERALKTVRRKIRNKISAMDSRKRKKVYVDGLEHRVNLCTKQNFEMQKKMSKMENENKSLMEQLKKLQSLVSKSTTKAAQSSTCVMVLLLSFALLIAPSFNPFNSSRDDQTQTYRPSGVVSRTLMHTDTVGDLIENEPITTGHFARPSNGHEEESLATNQKEGMDVANVDSGAIKTQAAPTNELAPSEGLANGPAETTGAHIVEEVKSSSVNQSQTDTRQSNERTQPQQQQQQVKRTVIHGDEM